MLKSISGAFTVPGGTFPPVNTTRDPPDVLLCKVKNIGLIDPLSMVSSNLSVTVSAVKSKVKYVMFGGVISLINV